MAQKSKKMLYIGGLDATVTEEILHAAFIPFGDIREVSIPKDFATNKHRGFGFVDYEEETDASAAISNMHGAELVGKVLKCNMAKTQTKLQSGKAVWEAEEYQERVQNAALEQEEEGQEREEN